MAPGSRTVERTCQQFSKNEGVVDVENLNAHHWMLAAAMDVHAVVSKSRRTLRHANTSNWSSILTAWQSEEGFK